MRSKLKSILRCGDPFLALIKRIYYIEFEHNMIRKKEGFCVLIYFVIHIEYKLRGE